MNRIAVRCRRSMLCHLPLGTGPLRACASRHLCPDAALPVCDWQPRARRNHLRMSSAPSPFGPSRVSTLPHRSTCEHIRPKLLMEPQAFVARPAQDDKLPGASLCMALVTGGR